MENLTLFDERTCHEILLEQLLVTLNKCLPKVIVRYEFKYFRGIIFTTPLDINWPSNFVHSVVASRVKRLQL